MILPSLQGSSAALRVVLIAVLWLGLISVLHAYLNADKQPADRILMGYMPVITNLAAPLVDEASRGTDLHLEAVKFASFAEMAEAFRSKHLQAAFIIAPLAIALYQQGVPLKIVYIGNRHESTLVVKKGASGTTLADLQGKTIAVPIRYSGHLLALKRHLRKVGLNPEAVRTLELAPPDMPAALAAGAIDGYFVGEPFASKSLENGIGTRLLDVEEIWPKFICNLMIVQDQLIKSHPDWVQTLVTASVKSGFWAQNHTEETVQLLSRYWGQDPKLVQYAFSRQIHRYRFDLYLPVTAELEEIVQEMNEVGLMAGEVDTQGMVEDRFARAVSAGLTDSLQDILVR